MSSPSPSESASLDPGLPVDVNPTYYWVWVEATRLYWQPSRGSAPLSPRLDLYPIIGRFYRPRPETKVQNSSVYITYLRRKGLLRRFGETFWVPESSSTIRVSGQVVFTPDDLDALLAGEERFQPPSPEVKPASSEETSDEASDSTMDGEEAEAGGGDESGQEDAPEAQPEVKAKKSRNRSKTAPIGKLVRAMWEAAEPTDDSAWRVISKSAARQLAVDVTGVSFNYVLLYRLSHVKSGEDHNKCLITDPNASFRETLSAVKGEQAPPQQAETPVSGLRNLTLEQISARIVEREANFSTQALEDERTRVLGETEAKRTELAAIDETRLRLREELRVLEASKEAIDGSIDTRIMQRQQDQELQDLNWLIDNKTRLDRIQASLAKAKPGRGEE